MTKMYYDVPTQVKFWDEEEGDYVGGIAYRDEIICGCCGGIIEIKEEYEPGYVPAGIVPIVEYSDWVDISSEVIGE